MNVEDYEWLKQVPAKSISSSSLVLVSKFARRVRSLNGRVLSLRDPLLFQNMLEEVLVSSDEHLAATFAHLIIDLKSVAVKAGLQVPEHLLRDPTVAHSRNLTYRGVAVK